MVERGYEPMTLVLRQRVIPADDQIASYLQIQPGTEVVDLLRLRFINDEPIQLVNSFIPYDLCPGAAEVDFSRRSLYEYFEKDCQLEISRGRRYIEAVSADKETARWLRVKNGAALIQLDSVSYLDNGQPVEYYRAFHRGDRSRFEVELVRSRRDQDEYLAGSAGYPGSSDFYKNSKGLDRGILMRKIVKVCMIGAGRVGKVHSNSINRYMGEAEVVAIVDPVGGGSDATAE